MSTGVDQTTGEVGEQMSIFDLIYQYSINLPLITSSPISFVRVSVKAKCEVLQMGALSIYLENPNY